MQLQQIDKQRYRKNLNFVIVGFIVSLLVLSLSFGQILIKTFSTVSDVTSSQEASYIQQDNTDESQQVPSNFKYNLLGVILGLLACASILHNLKSKAFFNEIYYVWQLKQLQNSIYRQLKKVEAKASEGNVNALIILNFYYQSLKQVYLLDDNTITLTKVENDIVRINDLIQEHNINADVSLFEKELLSKI
ncbi:DUF3087 family protein [Litorilituus lipolyticus]|uniref:DUF3087 domain-containing protein n=1 Tax=Litorilituus lipolyticus TaxID=2491017 RepID=A0A502KME6_9GAMM|nr:DUF3087 family protein [Litorilituus lipolyticus]TPH12830.1 DUF3087 domain-containing protein [Litorilituus lipolyticus]